MSPLFGIGSKYLAEFRGMSRQRSPPMEMGEGHTTSKKSTTPLISLTLWRLHGRGWQDFPEFRGTSPSIEIGKRRQGLQEFRGTSPLMGRRCSEGDGGAIPQSHRI